MMKVETIVAFGLLFALMIVAGHCQQVAFSVGSTQANSLNPDEIMTFDKVFTNVGNGYDTSSGIFTCPKEGLYLFQFYALSRRGYSLWLDLKLNDEYIVRAYANNEGIEGLGGNSVILDLKVGDKVYLEGGSSTLISSFWNAVNKVYATFLGHKIPES